MIPHPTVSGYRGIWYALGWKFEHGDKYTGGLGTYTADHQPMAVYAPQVHQTFFTYGGAPRASSRQLMIMVGCYDHALHRVPRPTVVHVDEGVDDPHDNASLQIDAAGFIWIFKSGRNTSRLGVIYRSAAPFSIARFERQWEGVITYPQAWYDPQQGFLLLHTKYTRGRELYWQSSPDGRIWGDAHKLAGFDGHYGVSSAIPGKVATFFNWHPAGDNDRRTNVYYAQSTDWGKTWTTAGGQLLALPLTDPANAALILDLQAEGKFNYTCDLNFDQHGQPILLFLVSRAGEPGPKGDPREWTILHWSGGAWQRRIVTQSDHNYDMGSLHVAGDTWTVVGPTETGPQRWATGGEIAQWASTDEGRTWRKQSQLTSGSANNHSYVRRPLAAQDPFFSFWADGNALQLSPSHLYFADSRGDQVWQLPYDMTADFAEPVAVAVPRA